MLAPDKLKALDETAFQDLCLRVHAVRDQAKRALHHSSAPAGHAPIVQDDRIFDACFDGPKKIAHMGVSALGEMAG